MMKEFWLMLTEQNQGSKIWVKEIHTEIDQLFITNCPLLKMSVPFRGTQRICSSIYLFPRGILLAGKNTGVSMSWLGNFVIDRGFAWELLTFSSISTRAGCRNSEDCGRLKKNKNKKIKKNPFLSQRVVTNIRRLVRVIALAEKSFVPILSLCSFVLDRGI